MEIYVVRSGDTVYQIARRYSTSMDDIIFANQLQNPNELSVGQALIIPNDETRHTVSRGDTLYSIARRYDVSLQHLIAANPQIAKPNRIYPGQTLVIPTDGQHMREIIVNGYITDATDSTLNDTLPYDQAAQSPFFRYYDGDGRQHEVWFEDARSLRAKYTLVDEYGLAGVSFWNLNNLFRTNFIVLESMFSVEKVL